MKITIEWTLPLSLVEDDDLIYSTNIVGKIDAAPGVYVFARKYAKKMTPLYIGQAKDLHSRIKTQLNNVKLMKQIQNWEKTGARVLLLGYLKKNGNQDTGKVLNIVENALIEHGLAEGHPLVNIQGTRKPVHLLTSIGSSYSKQIAPSEMFVKTS